MEAISLKKIGQYTGASFTGGDRVIFGVSIDSRDIGENCLFIAVKGENTDGHRYLKSAVENGAVAVMVHEELKESLGVPVLTVPNTERALLQLAAGYRSQFPIPLVAVTGSVGKTTTKDMVGAVLGTKYRTLKTDGNKNNQFGMPQTLLRLSYDTQAAVIEMGMSGLKEIEPLSLAARPDTAVITNVGVSHLEKLGTRENILKAKLEILAGLNPSGTLILNGDNDLLGPLGKETWPKILRCSLKDEEADFYACDRMDNGRETSFMLKAQGRSVQVRLPLPGEHNVMDALLAVAAGFCHGVALEDAVRALAGFAPSGLRQKIFAEQGVTVVADCYNANPDSMRAALSSFGRFPVTGKRIAVLGDMLELGRISEESHREMGKLCARANVDLLLCVGEESSLAVREAQKAGVDSWHFQTREALGHALKDVVKPGDAVLFKASHGMQLEKVIADVFPALAGVM